MGATFYGRREFLLRARERRERRRLKIALKKLHKIAQNCEVGF